MVSSITTNPSMAAHVLVAVSVIFTTVAVAEDGANAPAVSLPSPRRVAISQIAVTGNTLLPAAAIDAMLARYQGERSIDELRDAARTLQAMYREAGHGAVVVYLPSQAITDGRIELAVVEGRLARVTVVGNDQFSADNVRRALPQLVQGQTPLVQQIDNQIQFANDNPARKLALTLEPGAQPGEVDAHIQVSEEPASRFTLSLDDTGSPQTGRLRLGLGYRNAALFDADHQLAVQGQFAPEHPGAVRVFSASYRVPLYAAGVTLGAYATYSNVDAGSTPTAAGALMFNGRGRVLGVSAMRLWGRIGEFEQRVTASLDQREYLNDCAILGLPAGACGSAGESVTVHPLTLDYSLQRGGERPLVFEGAFSHNLALGGPHGGTANFEAVRPGATRDYDLLRFNAFAAWPLGDGWRLSGRLAMQVSGDALVPGEQFGLTGANAVRGYEERELVGDSGVTAGVEVTSPALVSNSFRLVAFGDAGRAVNRLGTLCNATQARCTAAAVGLGLRYGPGRFQLKLDLAQALRTGRSTERHSTRLHVQASVAIP